MRFNQGSNSQTPHGRYSIQGAATALDGGTSGGQVFDRTLPIPADSTDVGQSTHIRAAGGITTVAAPGTLTITLIRNDATSGPIILFTSGAIQLEASMSALAWILDLVESVESNATAGEGTVCASGMLSVRLVDSNVLVTPAETDPFTQNTIAIPYMVRASTLYFNQAATYSVSVEFDTVDATQVITLDQFQLEIQ